MTGQDYRDAAKLGYAVIEAFPLLRLFPQEVGKVIGFYRRMAAAQDIPGAVFFKDCSNPRGIMYLAGGCYAVLQKNAGYGFDGG